MKITKGAISKFISRYGTSPLVKVCAKLDSKSWLGKHLCPKNVTISNNL